MDDGRSEQPPRKKHKREKDGIQFYHQFEVPVNEMEACTFNRKIEGPTFMTVHNFVGLEWCLNVYPKGGKHDECGEYRDHIGLFLSYESGPWHKVAISFDMFFVCPNNGNPMCKYTSEEEFDVNDDDVFGTPNLLRNSVSELRKLSLISERDTVIFGAVLWIPQERFKWRGATEEEERNIDDKILLDEEEECFFGPLFPEITSTQPSETSDFQITAGKEKFIFNCHKLILNQKIREYLKSMIKSGINEGEGENLDLSNFSKESVYEVLHFIYCNTVSDELYGKGLEIFFEVLDLGEMLNLQIPFDLGPLFCQITSTGDSHVSDFNIIAGEERFIFKCHKVVLKQRIPQYFNSMMESGMKESEAGNLDLAKFSKESVEEVLRFIYRNSISSELSAKSADTFFQVLDLAEIFDIPVLKRECDKVMLGKLENDENFEEMIEKAEQYKLKHLMIGCLKKMTEKISFENAIKLFIKADAAEVVAIGNFAMNFIAENLRKFRNDGDTFSELTENLKDKISDVCEKRMLVEKQVHYK